MKEEVIDLPVAADLTECSYKEARQIAFEDSDYTNSDYVLGKLEVSMWDVDEALKIMATCRNCSVCVTPHYRADEWSFHVCFGSGLNRKVYSPGA